MLEASNDGSWITGGVAHWVCRCDVNRHGPPICVVECARTQRGIGALFLLGTRNIHELASSESFLPQTSPLLLRLKHMKIKIVGTCGLCHQPDRELQKSHMIPAGGYRRLRNPQSRNPNPVWVTPKFVVQTSSQTQDHFLCWDCEQRLRKNGEDWVLQNCYQRDGTFPLQSALQRAMPKVTSQFTKMYAVSDIKEIDTSKIAYFAASVFWRASAHDWHTAGVKTSDKGFLGPYQEDFRKYLLGERNFPLDVALRVSVPTTIDAAMGCGIMGPQPGARENLCKAYQLLFLGIAFEIFVGKNMNDFFRRHCFVQGNLITMTELLDRGIFFKWSRRIKGRPLPEK